MFLRPGAIHASHAGHGSGGFEPWAFIGLLALIVLGAVSGMLWAKAYREDVTDDDEEGL